ncbi:periplasmic sensor signal transduction histidine kinase [Pedobacter sp. BAL39]|uniref:sensor histidine kinase n=1 Tax=Pedobacter sp. BAL39 TaxID=391596 RepID=UPI0001559CF1|nr:HAMP domain-containing sensor histidine kinase [Pedobacter sp. BAL39]EDM36753.1 periplasmic sensor signal transduction histidine kinase [Pedobacter sp. BAL39]
MKLSTKLISFITGSKLAVVLLFIISLPFLVDGLVSEYTNNSLRRQQDKVIRNVKKNGIQHYLQGDDSYGSYTMLKEEYIALEPAKSDLRIDTIKTEQRVVEQDTLTYRILMHTFVVDQKSYLMEIGKTIASINQYNKPLQRIALYVLMSLIVFTLIIDLIFTRILIQPLGKIISTRLVNRKFPFRDHSPAVATSTQDFKYLDESLVLLMEQINDAFEKEREFTANASHELMTPISILQNKMENMLSDEHLPDHMAMKIVEMMKTLGRLKKISNSLLLISRIENEQFAKSATVNLKILIIEVMEEISHRLTDKNLRIDINIDRDTKLKQVNQDLLFQLFYNLINNAIKYNKENGSISITDEMRGNDYLINLQDTGIGITKEEVPFIFDRFRKTNLREQVGYGLGLAIVKSIATYHHIDIKVVSALQQGTTFTLTFRNVISAHP